MNAPATPGPGDSGSAAGSDSEQGSVSNGLQTEKVTLTLGCEFSIVPAPSGGGTYDKGTTVTIEAVEQVIDGDEYHEHDEYEFMKWSDGSTDRVRNIVVNNDMSLTALYEIRTCYM